MHDTGEHPDCAYAHGVLIAGPAEIPKSISPATPTRAQLPSPQI
jgi:hypothetical protein